MADSNLSNNQAFDVDSLITSPVMSLEEMYRLLNVVQVQAFSQLQEFAADSNFTQKMNSVFGEGNDYSAWKTAFATGNFADFPKIKILDGATLQGANGAYAESLNTIYFSSDFLQAYQDRPEAIASVFLEELGHHADAQINELDRQGDEGQIFSSHVQYLDLNNLNLDSIKSENDFTTITIDQASISIEKSENPESLQESFDIIFGVITDQLDSLSNQAVNAISGLELPLMGDNLNQENLSKITQIISNHKDSILNGIKSIRELDYEDVDADNSGFVSPYEVAKYAVDEDYISAMEKNGNQYILNLDFEDTWEWKFSINGDVGIPGLGLEFESDNVTVNVGLDFDLGLGVVNREKGLVGTSQFPNEFYINPRAYRSDEIAFTFGMTIDNLNAKGALGFLQLDIGNPDGEEGKEGANLTVNNEIRIDWKDLDSNHRISPGSELNVKADTEIDLKLPVTTNFDKITESLDLPTFLPEIQADISFHWDPIKGELSNEASFNVFPNFNLNQSGRQEFGNLKDVTIQSPTLKFENVTINGASLITEFAAPVVNAIQEITEPLNPFVEALNKEITLLEDLEELTGISFDEDGNGKINSFDLLQRFYPDLDTTLFQNFSELIELINDVDIPDLEGVDDLSNFAIKLPSFEVSGVEIVDNKIDLSNIKVVTEGEIDFIYTQLDALNAKFKNIAEGSELDTSSNLNAVATTDSEDNIIDDEGPGYGTWLKNLGSLSGGGVAFPFLDDPMQSIVDLFAGNTLDLMTYDMPEFSASFALDQEFPVMTGVDLSLGGEVTASADFDFGFDTFGLQRFAESEDKLSPSSIFSILDGFYVADPSNSDGEIPEVTIDGEIRAGGEVGIGIGGFDLAAAGITGGIEASLWADLVDPNSDGKVRGSELWTTLTTDPLGIFDIGGTFTAGAEVYAEYWNPFKFQQIRETLWESDRITLYEFDTSSMSRDRQPDLATLDNNTLMLNIGDRANERGDIFNEDRYEEVVIEGTEIPGSIAASSLRSFSMFSTLAAPALYSIPSNPVSISSLGFTQAYSGFDTIIANGGKGNTIIRMSNTNASLDFYGGEGDDIIQGASGNDTIRGGEGWNFIFGGGGADSINGGSKSDKLYGEDGDDQVSGGSGSDVLFGGFGNDSISGGDDDDHVNGDDGDDVIQGGLGNDALFGDLGHDEIAGEQGVDNIQGNLGDDTLSGGDDGDFIQGNEGDDFIRGDAGDDDISGGDDDDLLIGWTGNDAIDGGDGVDTVDYKDSADAVTVNIDEESEHRHNRTNRYEDSVNSDNPDAQYLDLEPDFEIDDGTAYDGFETTDSLKALENIIGSAYDDILIGNNSDNSIQGMAGNDWIFSSEGNDNLDGGEGTNIISYRRDPGDDDRSVEGVTVNLTEGIARDGWGNNDLISNFRDVVGSEYNDFIVGDEQTNIITGGGGDDAIGGGDGIDTLYGEYGEDRIIGGMGEDFLFGNQDDDVIFGDLENVQNIGDKDIINGGAGNDEIHSGGGDDEVYGNGDDDTIFGDDGNDTLKGESGNDFINGGADGDFIYGGEDDDLIQGATGEDYIDAGTGNDIADGGDDADKLYGRTGNDTLDGGAGNDKIYGEENDDSLFGSGGEDLIEGGIGNDFADGGDDADLIYGQEGDDTLDGGADNDEIYGEVGHDDLFGSAGEDFIDAGAGNDSADGGDDADLIYGRDGEDTLDGGSGDDEVYGEAGDDFLFGSAGDDYLDGDIGSDYLDGGDDNDQLFGRTGSDTLDGGRGDDQLDGAEGDDELYGQDGNDVLNSGIGNDILDGGDGNDTLNAASGDDYLDGGDGDDILDAGAGDDEATGGDGNDQIDGGAGSDYLDGGADHDLINAGSGDDVVTGGTGNDTLNGNNGNDELYGEAGDDVLDGGAGDDILDAGDGDNTVLGGTGDDELYGGDGNDFLDGGDGNDLIDGGDGIDEVSFETSSVGVRINLDDENSYEHHNYDHCDDCDEQVANPEPEFTLNPSEVYDELDSSDTLRNIENIIASNHDDVVMGNSSDNLIRTLDGDDFIAGHAGDDTLDGGAGSDTASYHWDPDGVHVDLEKGRATDGYDDHDRLISIENVIGSDEDDTIQGDEQTNILIGNDGDDDIKGKAGNDQISGGAGEDSLDGGAGDDVLSGDAGEDRLEGDDGNDYLCGGEDDDSLYGGADQDTLQGGDGDDSLKGGDGDDLLEGGLGDDSLYGEDGADTLEGGYGNDSLKGGADEDTLYGYDGHDYLEGGTEDDLLDGGRGDDTLKGEDGDDVLYGQAGNDTLDGSYGRDYLDGGAGNDQLEGDDGRDTLLGGAGDDTLKGGSNDDSLTGDAGDDHLEGNSGDDSLDGGAGDDILNGGDGNDQLDGGSGNDHLTGQSGHDVLDGGSGHDYIEGGSEDDTLIGGSGNDTLYGDKDYDILEGGMGDDFLDGGTGDDTLTGDAGNDELYGARGEDVLAGGSGDDTLSGGDNADILYGQSGRDRIEGDGGHDELFGQEGDDSLYGGNGRDTLDGGSGNDSLRGGNDADILTGFSGDDVLYGEDDDDLINGGMGQDTLSGGEGSDTFVMAFNQGLDTILDFNIHQDVFGLADGLTVDQLSITQGIGDLINDTLISFTTTGEVLATLVDVQADTLTSSNFTTFS